MKKAISRPSTLGAADLDVAVKEALQRVAQVRELQNDECAGISGGLVMTVPKLIDLGPITSGFIARDPIEITL